MLLVEQNAREALRLAARAYVLRLGTVVHEGPSTAACTQNALCPGIAHREIHGNVCRVGRKSGTSNRQVVRIKRNVRNRELSRRLGRGCPRETAHWIVSLDRGIRHNCARWVGNYPRNRTGAARRGTIQPTIPDLPI
jgi:hypothetical protein